MANEVLGTAYVEIQPKVPGSFASNLERSMGSAGTAAANSLGRSFGSTAERSIASAVTTGSASATRTLSSRMASAGLSAGEALAKALGRGSTEAKTSLNGVTEAAEKTQQAVGKAGSSAGKLGSSISSSAHSAETALKGVSSSADAASTHVGKVGTAAEKTSKGFSSAKSTGSALFSVISQNAGGALGPITEIQEKMMGVGQAFSDAEGKAHKMLIGTGAALTGIGLYTSQLASNDKAAMAGIQGAVEESGKSWDDYEKQMESASKSGAKFGFTTTQTANALAQLTRLTHDPDKAMQLLNGTEDLAVAKNISLDAAATKVGKAMTTGGKAAAMLGINLDSATKAAKAAETATKAHDAALTAQEKAVGKLNDLETIDASKKKLSTSAEIALNKARVAVTMANGKVTETTKAMADAQDRAKQATQQSGSAAQQLATTYGGQASIKTHSFAGEMKKLGAEAENTAAAFGTKFGHALTVAGPAMMGIGAIIQTGIIGKLGSGIGEFTRFSKVIDDVGTTGPTMLGKIANGLSNLPGMVSRGITALTGLGAAEETAAAGAEEAAAAETELDAAMDANPIFIIVGALAVLAAGLAYAYTHSKTFRDIVKDIGHVLATVLMAPIHLVIAGFKLLADAVGGAFNFIKSHWQLIVGIITGPIGIIIMLVVKFRHDIVAAFEAAWNAVKTATTAAWNAIKAFFTAWWNVTKAIFTTALNAVKTAVTAVWNAVETVTKTVWNAVKAFFTTIWNGLRAIVTTVTDAIRSVIQTVWNVIDSIFRRVWDGLKNYFTSVWDAIRTIVTTVTNTIRSVITTVMNTISNIIHSVLNGIKSVWDTIWNGIKNTVSTVFNAAKSVVESVLNAISSAFRSARDGIKSVWDTISGIFKTPINIVIDVVNGFDRVVDDVTSKIGLGRPLPEGIRHLAGGGPVYGPGTETSDSILAFLSHKEHVTNAKSAKKNRGLLSWMDRHPGEEVPFAGGFSGGGFLDQVAHLVTAPVTDTAHGVEKGARDAAAAGLDLAEAPIKALLNAIPTSPDGGPATWVKTEMTNVMNKVNDWVKGKEASVDTPVAGAQGAAAWRNVVIAALQRTGYPTTDDYVNHVLAQIMFESSGNPNAVQGNIGDVNNRTGDLAKGLMQVIGTTFESYRDPSLPDNRFDPLANVTAALRYIRGRYHGDILGVLGHGHGYSLGGFVERILAPHFVGAFANGGVVPRTGIALVHQGETVIPKFASGGPVDGSAAWNPWTMGNRNPGVYAQNFYDLAMAQMYKAAVDMRTLGYGGTSNAQIRSAQAALHVKVDGIIGPQTYAALENAATHTATRVTSGVHTVINGSDSVLVRMHNTLLAMEAKAVAATNREGPGAASMPMGAAPYVNPSGLTVTMTDSSGNDTTVPLQMNAGNIVTNQARTSELIGASAQYNAELAAWQTGNAKSNTLLAQQNAQKAVATSISRQLATSTSTETATHSKLTAATSAELSVRNQILMALSQESHDRATNNAAAVSADQRRLSSLNATYAADKASVSALTEQDAALKKTITSLQSQEAAAAKTAQTLSFYKTVQDGVNNSLAIAWWNTIRYADSIREQLASSLQTAYLPAITSIQQSLTTQGQSGTDIASLFSVQDGYGPTSASGAVAVLQAKVTQMRTFVTKLRGLAAQGVDPTLLAEIAQAGPDAGSTIADQLASDPATTNALNALESELSTIETQGAQVIGNQAVAIRSGGFVDSTGSNIIDPTGLFESGTGGATLAVYGDLNVRSDTDIAKIGQQLTVLNNNTNRALGQ